MYTNKKVRNIMVPVNEYPVINENNSAAEAFKLMRDYFHQKDGTWFGFQSMLVLKDSQKLVGILTLRGLLKAFKIQATLDHFLKSDPVGLFFMPGFYNSLEISVKNIMRPIQLITIQEDSDIFEAIVTLVKWRINSLPVMSGQELVGIVRTIDLFWSVGELLE